jgi:hypothetical protein
MEVTEIEGFDDLPLFGGPLDACSVKLKETIEIVDVVADDPAPPSERIDCSVELWRWVVGYEGYYRVSNWGRVWSERRKQELASNDRGTGYPVVWLRRGGKKETCTVHRLVAVAWIANPLDKPHVNHIDHDKKNARADNLEWVTRSENMRHSVMCGVGTANTSPNEVLEIKRLYSEGYKVNHLARMFNKTRATIYGIVKNKSWAYVS